MLRETPSKFWPQLKESTPKGFGKDTPTSWALVLSKRGPLITILDDI